VQRERIVVLMKRLSRNPIVGHGRLHDGVVSFLVHDINPESVMTFIRLAPCLLDELDHLTKWFVGQPKSKLLQAPDDKLSGSQYLCIVGVNVEEVDRGNELQLGSSNN
jgi:hypothetical protein